MSDNAFRFGVNDSKIAPWQSAGTWGDEIDLYGVQNMEFVINTLTADQRGDDDLLDTHARPNGVRVTAQNAAITMAAVAALLGETQTTSPSAAILSQNDTVRPYVGVAAKVLGTGDGGDHHMIAYKCKLTGDIGFSLQDGQYVSPRMELRGVKEEVYGYYTIVRHDDEAAVTIPLT